jgi:HSP20 family protein
MLGWRALRFNDPWEEFGRISQELNRALGRFGALEPGARVFPPLNAYDDGESFVVHAEIPGVEPSSLEVSATGRALTIKGERKPMEAADLSYHRRERDHGVWNRTLSLPQPVDADKIRASYKDGILEVILPKAAEARPRRVEIQG